MRVARHGRGWEGRGRNGGTVDDEPRGTAYAVGHSHVRSSASPGGSRGALDRSAALRCGLSAVDDLPAAQRGKRSPLASPSQNVQVLVGASSRPSRATGERRFWPRGPPLGPSARRRNRSHDSVCRVRPHPTVASRQPLPPLYVEWLQDSRA
ncbi:hypothetical protein NDU88_002283 [Pleurodeles waltl]|uniref:Uncharacterized protein n=1 Tax=Pleurodeles waltl TaxID=8319 RepID=A0AAV7Q6F6_PLEWA|nr:hypothetical protein NDU88_002283 [Pleurodeles waltl]